MRDLELVSDAHIPHEVMKKGSLMTSLFRDCWYQLKNDDAINQFFLPNGATSVIFNFVTCVKAEISIQWGGKILGVKDPPSCIWYIEKLALSLCDGLISRYTFVGQTYNGKSFLVIFNKMMDYFLSKLGGWFLVVYNTTVHQLMITALTTMIF